MIYWEEVLGKPPLTPSNISTMVANHITCKPICKLTTIRTNFYGIETYATFEVLRLPKEPYWVLFGRPWIYAIRELYFVRKTGPLRNKIKQM